MLVKCKDCRFVVPFFGDQAEKQCVGPVPWWMLRLHGMDVTDVCVDGSLVPVDQEHACASFEAMIVQERIEAPVERLRTTWSLCDSAEPMVLDEDNGQGSLMDRLIQEHKRASQQAMSFYQELMAYVASARTPSRWVCIWAIMRYSEHFDGMDHVEINLDDANCLRSLVFLAKKKGFVAFALSAEGRKIFEERDNPQSWDQLQFLSAERGYPWVQR